MIRLNSLTIIPIQWDDKITDVQLISQQVNSLATFKFKDNITNQFDVKATVIQWHAPNNFYASHYTISQELSFCLYYYT